MRLVALLLLSLAWTGIAAADQNSTFQEGMDFGNSFNQGAFSGITSGAVQDKIPAYGTAPVEAQYFQGGKGNISGYGGAKIQTCAGYTPSQDKIANQECEAINFLAKSRPKYDISKDDPMFQKAKQIGSDPYTYLEQFGWKIDHQSTTNCALKTEAVPATYTEESCIEAANISNSSCTIENVPHTNCQGQISYTPQTTQIQVTTAPITTYQSKPATPVYSESCRNYCQTTSCSTTWTPSPYAICSSGDATRNSIISVFKTWLGRCPADGGLTYYANLVYTKQLNGVYGVNDPQKVEYHIANSQEALGWKSAGKPNIRFYPDFCGSSEMMNPNYCRSSNCTTSTYPADACTNQSAGLICSSADSVESAIIGYFKSHLGRCPASDGLAYWKGIYNQGYSLSQISTYIYNSFEGSAWRAAGSPTERESSLCSNGMFVSYNTCKVCGCGTGTTVQQCTTNTSYKCNSNEVLDGTNCRYQVTTCPSGYTLQNGTCAKKAYAYKCTGAATSSPLGTNNGATPSIYYPTTVPLLCSDPDPQNYGANQIIDAFKTYLGRCPAESGLYYWVSQRQNGISLDDVINYIRTSAEAEHWNSLGKPMTRAYPMFCGNNMLLSYPDKCIESGINYVSDSPNPLCKGNVDYYEPSQTCAPGTSATRVVGYDADISCVPSPDAVECVVSEESCASGSGVVNGIPYSNECLTKTVTSVCASNTDNSECQALQQKGCNLVSSQCEEDTRIGSTCAMTEKKYSCQKTPESTKQYVDCSGTMFCANGICVDNSYENDQDFALSMALLETAREGGVYGGGSDLFRGCLLYTSPSPRDRG